MTSIFARRKATRQTPPPKRAPKTKRGLAHPLDDALDDTFPASDPVAAQSPSVAGDGGHEVAKDKK